MALLKSPVSVKLNLGIIISTKTAESHLSSLAPTSTEIQRKGVAALIARTIHDGVVEGIASRCVQGGREMMSGGSEEEREKD